MLREHATIATRWGRSVLRAAMCDCREAPVSPADRHAVCVCVLDTFAVSGGAELQGAAYVQEAVKWDSDSDSDESDDERRRT